MCIPARGQEEGHYEEHDRALLEACRAAGAAMRRWRVGAAAPPRHGVPAPAGRAPVHLVRMQRQASRLPAKGLNWRRRPVPLPGCRLAACTRGCVPFSRSRRRRRRHPATSTAGAGRSRQSTRGMRPACPPCLVTTPLSGGAGLNLSNRFHPWTPPVTTRERRKQGGVRTYASRSATRTSQFHAPCSNRTLLKPQRPKPPGRSSPSLRPAVCLPQRERCSILKALL